MNSHKGYYFPLCVLAGALRKSPIPKASFSRRKPLSEGGKIVTLPDKRIYILIYIYYIDFFEFVYYYFTSFIKCLFSRT